MKQEYHDAVTHMEDMKVMQEYIMGWQGGFLGHPKREEQRITAPYQAGYDDGGSSLTENFSNWIEPLS